MSLFTTYLEMAQKVPSNRFGIGGITIPENLKGIVENIPWGNFTTESSQRDNLYDYVMGKQDFKEFVNGIFSKSALKKAILAIPENKRDAFKIFAKKVWYRSYDK